MPYAEKMFSGGSAFVPDELGAAGREESCRDLGSAMDEETRKIVRQIAELLTVAQRRRDLSSAALAELSGVPLAELEQLLRAEREPTLETLWRLAGALQVKPADLLPPGTT